jgi:hypothetical protein
MLVHRHGEPNELRAQLGEGRASVAKNNVATAAPREGPAARRRRSYSMRVRCSDQQ